MLIKNDSRSKISYKTIFDEFKTIGYCSFRIVDKHSKQELFCAIMRVGVHKDAYFTFRIYNTEVGPKYEYPLIFQFEPDSKTLRYNMQINQHLKADTGIEFSINHVLKKFAKMYEAYFLQTYAKIIVEFAGKIVDLQR